MAKLAIVLSLLPALAVCTGDGNIHLLEEDVASALRVCSVVNIKDSKDDIAKRQRRSEENLYDNPTPHIDGNTNHETNPYNHERRNTTFSDQMYVLNGTNSNYSGDGYRDGGEKFVNTVPRPSIGYANFNANYVNYTRSKRNEPLINKDDNDQCLSQCVFANLQVVDSRGIPREAELWNKIQTAVTSQQSRTLLKDQIHACFQELQTESEDNGCSYSNKLEKCLMLRFSDRKSNKTQSTSPDNLN